MCSSWSGNFLCKESSQKKENLEFYFCSKIQEKRVRRDTQREKIQFNHNPPPPCFEEPPQENGSPKIPRFLVHHSNMIWWLLTASFWKYMCMYVGRKWESCCLKEVQKQTMAMTYKQLNFFLIDCSLQGQKYMNHATRNVENKRKG